MNIEPVRVYAREVICGECGTSMFLSWQDGQAIYQHPDWLCEFKGKRLRTTAIICSVNLEDEE